MLGSHWTYVVRGDCARHGLRVVVGGVVAGRRGVLAGPDPARMRELCSCMSALIESGMRQRGAAGGQASFLCPPMRACVCLVVLTVAHSLSRSLVRSTASRPTMEFHRRELEFGRQPPSSPPVTPRRRFGFG